MMKKNKPTLKESMKHKWYEIEVTGVETIEAVTKVGHHVDTLCRTLSLVMGEDLLKMKCGQERHVVIHPGLIEASIICDRKLCTYPIDTTSESYDRRIDRRACQTATVRVMWMPRKAAYNPQGEAPLIFEFVGIWNSDYGIHPDTFSHCHVNAFAEMSFYPTQTVPEGPTVKFSRNAWLEMVDLLENLMLRKVFSRIYPAKCKVIFDELD